MDTRSFVPHTASAREQTHVLPALLAQSLPKVSFQPYFPWSCTTAFHRKEMFMKYWYWALSNIQSGLVQALLFVSSKCIFTALILLIYHCWLQWRLSWFTFTGTQKASLLRQNSGMFSSCILNDVERAKDEHLYHWAWRKKKYRSGLLTAKNIIGSIFWKLERMSLTLQERQIIFLSLINVCHQFLKVVHLGGFAQYRFLFLLQPSVWGRTCGVSGAEEP